MNEDSGIIHFTLNYLNNYTYSKESEYIVEKKTTKEI